MKLVQYFVVSIVLMIFISMPALAVQPTNQIEKKGAENQLIDLTSKGVNFYKPDSNQNSLSPPSNQRPEEIVREYLRNNNFQPGVVSDLLLTTENINRKRNITHLRFEQSIENLKVYGVYVKAAVNSQGELTHLIENIISPTEALKPASVSAQQALDIVINRHYPDLSASFGVANVKGNVTIFTKNANFLETPKATAIAIASKSGSVVEGFLVETWDNDNMLRHTLVNDQGKIVHIEVRTQNDSYHIFPDNPADTPQTTVAGPGAGNTESPNGWVFTDTTTGNNVDAFLDRDNDNAPDVNGRPISASKEFLTAADLTAAPTTADNQKVSVQNLFYLNNYIHDLLYRHGFNEAAGNFQEDNFGLGGVGSDSVQANAQDGGGVNNANFATPLDGSNPRMQMYIWNFSSPNRDGDLESDIVYHEYGHGLTWRMIGSMNGRLSGAIGEGMSDALALLINEDDVMGSWSVNRTGGIRRYPYTNYPLDYADVVGASVHQDGEIYAATIWRLWELWQENGLAKDLLFDYIIGGMNYTPSNPAYEDMRDGILAGITDVGHQCLVWQAFAQFGIGDGAQGLDSGGIYITPSYITVPACFDNDTVAPDPVSDLAITGSSGTAVNLQWSATGDDGSSGIAVSYDIRYSTSPITAANFDAATQYPWVGRPLASGNTENLSVDQLQGSTQYYFALKVVDDVLNQSPISNVVSVTTDEVTPIFVEETDYNWIDASAGTSHTLSDDSSVLVQIGFNFEFFGNFYSELRLSSNGYLTFGTEGRIFSNTDIPNTNLPNNMIAPFWDDLNPGSGGQIRSLLEGVSPNRRLTIAWLGVPHFPAIGAVSFQATLYEGSNEIVYQYQDVIFDEPTFDSGLSATIGIENANGTEAVRYSYNRASLTNNFALRFFTGLSSLPPVLEVISDQTVNEGETVSFMIYGSDPNGTIPALSMENAPFGAELIDNEDGTGLFTWTTAYIHAGVYTNINITATDADSLSDTKTFSITVNDIKQTPSFEPVLIKDVMPGKEPTRHRYTDWENNIVYDGYLYYLVYGRSVGDEELWRTNGTKVGTEKFLDVANVRAASSPIVFNREMYFWAEIDESNEYTLWKSDGTQEGTVLVKDFGDGDEPLFPSSLTVSNGKLFFSIRNQSGRTLWISDGTAEGTVLVKAISDRTNPVFFSFNNEVFFQSYDDVNGDELWKSDGTSEGTKLLKDINPGVSGSVIDLRRFTVFENELYFAARSSDGFELWKTDGSSSGTIQVKDIFPGTQGSMPAGLKVFNGELYFTADDGVHGGELWKTDGTSEGTVLANDINPGISSSNPNSLFEYNTSLYFAASSLDTGRELWKYDAINNRAELVKDINDVGSSSSGPGAFNVFNGKLYFFAYSSIFGRELWQSDGSTEGTTLVKDIFPGVFNSQGQPFIRVFGESLYFNVVDGLHGYEVWAYTPMDDRENTVDDTILMPITATNYSGDDFTYSVTGLPPGLSINSDTGLISGVINASAISTSPHQVSVVVDDGVDSVQASFVWTIKPELGEINTTDSSVVTSYDDAEENENGVVSLNSSDLELVQDGSNNQTVGMRFSNIQVPQGASITNAYLEFQVDEISTGVLNVVIAGEATANSSIFNTNRYNISRRTKTSESVAWNSEEDWLVKGELQQSPDISPVIQAIVEQSGWAEGNALSIIMTGSTTGKRVAESIDGDVAGAPRLIVEYRSSSTDLPTVATPTISPNGGTYTDGVTVTLNATTSDAVMYYTLDGSEPTENDYLYTDPFDIVESATLKVRGFLGGYDSSTVASANFVVNTNTPPTLDPIGNQIVSENEILEFIVSASDLESVPGFTADLSGLPEGDAVFVDLGNGTGVFTWRPLTGDSISSPYSVTITAFDGADFDLTVSETFNITVNAPPSGEPLIVQSQVIRSDDDAEENNNGVISLTSSDLELVQDGTSNQTVGMRFPSMAIPPGATISNAYLEFQVDEISTGSLDIAIAGQLIDDAPRFSSSRYNISNRDITNSSVPWASEEDWSVRGVLQQSPDIRSVIQEIVDQGSWVEGNALAIIITGSSNGKRVAESFNGDAAGAPKLIVEYRSGGTDLPTIATPSIEPNGGTYTDRVTVTLDSATADAVLYYTLDGSEPTETDNLYTVPFDITSSGTLTVKGFLGGYNPSSISRADFVINTDVNTAPSLAFIGNQSVEENSQLTVDVSATDAEGPAPSLSADLSNLPVVNDAIFVDYGDGTGQLTWTPIVGDSDASPFAVTITATDGVDNTLTDAETFNINVSAQTGGETVVVQSQVARSDDDAEENNSGVISLTSSDLELVQDGTSSQTVGMRFPSMAIPPGATINNAYLEFQVDEISTGNLDIAISGQLIDDAPRFASSRYNISNRDTTNSSVPWTNEEDWSVRGVLQQSPDISLVIQEIVDQGSWLEGNALAIIITGSSNGKRVAESFNGDAAGAPKLIVEYRSGGTDLPTIATPSIQPNGGTYTDRVTVTLDSATADAVLYYTLDGSEPTESDSLYTVPFDITESATLTVKGFLGGYNPSVISRADFVINTDANTAPTLDAIGNQSVAENSLLTVDLSATDAEGPAPSLSADLTSLPAINDAVFIDNGDGTGQLTWTPIDGDSGTSPFAVTVTATDGVDNALTDAETFNINVSAQTGGETVVVQSQVARSDDDAEENSNGVISLTSSDLELVQDGTSNQTVGMRFPSMAIPPGATISNAYLEFQVDEISTGSIDIAIAGQLIDDAPSFTGSRYNISNRDTTNSSVPWTSEEDWSVRRVLQQSPNISPVIQEIVDQGGWLDGNALAIIITGSSNGKRVAESFNGDAAGAPKLIVEYTFGTPDSTPSPTMVTIPAGSYQMGDLTSPDGNSQGDGQADEVPVHTVTLPSFDIGEHEVTFTEYDRYLISRGIDPTTISSGSEAYDEGFGRGDRPVINVSWNDIQAYINWLNTELGIANDDPSRYRLPSESEWEYVTRAGTTTQYYWGDSITHDDANYGTDSCCAGLAVAGTLDAYLNTSPVNQFPVNAWNIYDTHGNVWEWVEDCYATYPATITNGTAVTSCTDNNKRMLRGGSWLTIPWGLRAADRFNQDLVTRLSDAGFRLARSL